MKQVLKNINILGGMKTIILVGSVVLMEGCTTADVTDKIEKNTYTDMQSIALCQINEQANMVENKITAEYGFKRFAKNTYRPVLDYTLFGHEVRIIELNPTTTKIYAAGNPTEFGHHFNWLIKNVVCENNSCQAPIGDNQTLHIYKANIRKSKDTTIIECTKPEHETHVLT
ncbi:MAG: hypothetical protein ACWIPH_04675 [Ostreibacterium sp.]